MAYKSELTIDPKKIVNFLCFLHPKFWFWLCYALIIVYLPDLHVHTRDPSFALQQREGGWGIIRWKRGIAVPTVDDVFVDDDVDHDVVRDDDLDCLDILCVLPPMSASGTAAAEDKAAGVGGNGNCCTDR